MKKKINLSGGEEQKGNKVIARAQKGGDWYKQA